MKITARPWSYLKEVESWLANMAAEWHNDTVTSDINCYHSTKNGFIFKEIKLVDWIIVLNIICIFTMFTFLNIMYKKRATYCWDNPCVSNARKRVLKNNTSVLKVLGSRTLLFIYSFVLQYIGKTFMSMYIMFI